MPRSKVVVELPETRKKTFGESGCIPLYIILPGRSAGRRGEVIRPPIAVLTRVARDDQQIRISSLVDLWIDTIVFPIELKHRDLPVDTWISQGPVDIAPAPIHYIIQVRQLRLKKLDFLHQHETEPSVFTFLQQKHLGVVRRLIQ